MAIVVDMDKARAIHLERIRAARTPLFTKLDAEWMRAIGQRDMVAADAIEAERQNLRDIPETVASQIAAADTPQNLKIVWPAALAEQGRLDRR